MEKEQGYSRNAYMNSPRNFKILENAVFKKKEIRNSNFRLENRK
jgi:hypothetical protein